MYDTVTNYFYERICCVKLLQNPDKCLTTGESYCNRYADFNWLCPHAAVTQDSVITELHMPPRAAQTSAVARPMEDELRLRRGIGTALLLASAVWIGVVYAVLLMG
jgi:hypothetical protein